MLAQFNRRKIITSSNFRKKSTEISRILPFILSRLSKETLAKSKFNKKTNNNKNSYTYTSKSNVEKIICIKDAFLKLSTKKVIKINIITKDLLKKQIIISMSKNNSEVISNFTNFHILNINRYLKKTKLNITTDFIWVENNKIIITTNKVLTAQDMSIIEIYLKETENINLDYIDSSHLLKSKSYLKILSLSYTLNNTNLPITSKIIEKVIKKTHIFNNIILVLKLRIIKTSSKSDIAIVWIDIWNSQNKSKAKSIINWKFNIRWYITMVYGININFRVLQYKNCWK